MKYNYLLVLLFLLPAFVASQTPQKIIAFEDAAFNAQFINAKKIPTVKGKLINITVEDLAKINIKYTLVTPFSETQISKTAKVAKDGSFSLVVDYPLPYQQILLTIDEGILYTSLIVSADLFIELDIRKIKAQRGLSFNGDGVKYLGSDGPITTYFNDLILYKRSEQTALSEKRRKLMSNKKLDDDEFMQQYDELYKAIADIDNSFIKEHPSPYAWLIGSERLSDYYADLCVRNFGKPMNEDLWKSMIAHKVYMVSNNNMNFYNTLIMYIKSMPGNWVVVNQSEVYDLPDLTKAERAVVDTLKAAQNKKMSPADFKQISQLLQPRFHKLLISRNSTRFIYYLDSLFSPAKADFFKLRIGSKDLADQKILYEGAMVSMHTQWCKRVIKSEYEKTLKKIADINGSLAASKHLTAGLNLGEPLLETSFGAKLYKIKKMSADDFLAKLKLAFNENALLLDFWATWCIPCLAQMPYSKKIHEQAKDLPVSFIYLCTTNSSDEAKWKTKVTELKQPGIHFLVDDSLETELMNKLSLSGYPGYAFINRKGIYKPGTITNMYQMDILRLTELIKNIQ